MLRSIDDLQGFAITATDGAIGEVNEFYLDDESWAIRYLVVSTGTWLASRYVLISPLAIKQVDRTTNQIYVNLTMKQVERSPDIDTRKPVSRQHETAYFDYYGYPYYWGGPYLWGAAAFPAALALLLARHSIAARGALLMHDGFLIRKGKTRCHLGPPSMMLK